MNFYKIEKVMSDISMIFGFDMMINVDKGNVKDILRLRCIMIIESIV